MLIVTIAALVMAASLGWFAYRLLQEEQRRSEARVALLTAALEADPLPIGVSRESAVTSVPPPSGDPTRPAPDVAASPLPATPRIVMLEDDGRSMRAFASERSVRHTPSVAREEAADLLRTPAQLETSVHDVVDTQTRAAGLFADVPEARPADGRGLMALAAVALVGLLAIGYVWFGRPDATGSPAASRGTTASATATAPAAATTTTPVPAGGVPLELLSLAHEQRGDTLRVRGLVRNPVSSSDRVGVLASVMLLDQAGGVLGSGRARIDAVRLQPGDDAGFSVEVPSHKDVRRYRVTFRSADGALVSHTDKRSAKP